MLTASWSRGQRRCYRVLKAEKELINRNRGDNEVVLSSYYFKTLMFWSCENRPSEFLNEEILKNSVKELLICVAGWMNRKRCSNYFIPGNNMMDHIPVGVNTELEIKLVGEMYREIDELFVCVDDNGSRYMEIKYQKWLVNTNKLISHFKLFDIPEKGCTLMEDQTDFDIEGLIFEYNNLYHGLRSQFSLLKVARSNNRRRPTAAEDLTDFYKGLIFEFKDLYREFHLQLLTLEVESACDAETLQGISEMTRIYLEEATERENGLVSNIENMNNREVRNYIRFYESWSEVDARGSAVLSWRRIFSLKDACRKDVIYDRQGRLDGYFEELFDISERSLIDSLLSAKEEFKSIRVNGDFHCVLQGVFRCDY